MGRPNPNVPVTHDMNLFVLPFAAHSTTSDSRTVSGGVDEKTRRVPQNETH